MRAFFIKIIIFLLILSSPLFIFIANKNIEHRKTKDLDKIIEQMEESLKICNEIIQLYEENSPLETINDYFDFSLEVQEKIYKRCEDFHRNLSGYVMSSIEKIASKSQRHSFELIKYVSPKDFRMNSYSSKILYNNYVPKGEGSYCYFKENKMLLEHIIHSYNNFFHNYEDKRQLLIEYYKYYDPFNSGFQRALDEYTINSSKI